MNLPRSRMMPDAASPTRLGRLLEGMADIAAGALLALYFSPRQQDGRRNGAEQPSLARAPFP